MNIKKGFKRGMAVLLTASFIFAGISPVNADSKTAVKLNKNNINIKKGGTAAIRLLGAKAKVKWSVSDKKKLSVKAFGRYNQKCNIKAKKSGKANVTAKYKGKKHICKVTVASKNKNNQFKVTETPGPMQMMPITEAPGSMQVVTITEAPKTTQAAQITEAPKTTQAAQVTEAPEPTNVPQVTDTPEPANTAGAEDTPVPTTDITIEKMPSLEDMVAANQTEKLLKNYKSMMVVRNYLPGFGYEWERYITGQGGNYICCDYETYGDMVYKNVMYQNCMYSLRNNKYSVTLYPFSENSPYLREYDIAFIEPETLDDEILLSSIDNGDGTYTLRTRYKSVEQLKDVFYPITDTWQEGDAVFCIYKVDAATLACLYSEIQLVHIDGTVTSLTSAEIKYNVEAPAHMTDVMEYYDIPNNFASDSLRKVTLVVNPDTEDEECFTGYTHKGELMNFYNPVISQDGDKTILKYKQYTDRECKTEYVRESQPLDEDFCTYMKEEPVNITLIHTNDIHGNFSSGVGIAKVAALKKNSENAILVDAGDATQGVALALLTKGENVIKLMNAAGYDVMAAGNHEFDYGQEQLLKNAGIADFPILAANVLKDGVPLTNGAYSGAGGNNGANYILNIHGVNVGFFGLTTVEASWNTNPGAVNGLVFRNEIETAKEQIDELERKGADVIICLAHMGDDDSAGNTSIALAEAMTGEYRGRLDVIIDAHSHTRENVKVNGIQICQTGTALAAVGRIRLVYDRGNVYVAENGTELLDAKALAELEPDPYTTAVLDELNADVKNLSKEVIAETKNTLWASTINGVAEARITETNYGNLIADSMISAGDSYIRSNQAIDAKYRNLPITAVINGGGIRALIPNGKINKGQVVNTLPYGNDIYYKVVTPSVLYAMMEHSLCNITGQDQETGRLTGETTNITFSGFLQVGGMKIVYNPYGGDAKVMTITLVGETEALSRTDNERQIILASNSYIMNGGNEYTMLGSIPVLVKGCTEGEALLSEIAKRTENGRKVLDIPVTENRIMAKSDYIPKDYTVHIRIKDVDGNIVSGRNVSYYVDNRLTGTAEVDSEGLLNLTVPDGPHSIKLYEEQNEVYVNNYTGAGVLYYEGWAVDYPILICN